MNTLLKFAIGVSAIFVAFLAIASAVEGDKLQTTILCFLTVSLGYHAYKDACKK